MRYKLSDNNRATFDKVLLTNIPSPNGNHNAGDLHFGKDGYLYVSVGDGGCNYTQPTMCGTDNDAARDRNVLLGKILRIKRNGGIPPTTRIRGQRAPSAGLRRRTAAPNLATIARRHSPRA